MALNLLGVRWLRGGSPSDHGAVIQLISLLILLLQLFLRPAPELPPAGSAAKSTPPHDTTAEGRKQRARKGGQE